MKDKIFLFITGFLQVVTVAVNTWQIAHQKYLGAIIVGFLISFIWSFNVKKIAFGTNSDRVIYSIGAMFGVWAGMLITQMIYN